MSDCAGAQNPSPINLSQSFAKPCDILCDLVMDDAYATDGFVVIDGEKFLVLYSMTNLGTCKFNGEGYTCYALVVTHPSLHTIENIQADAEVMALFRNPTGKILQISSLIRVNPAETQSTSFLNKFIPYVVPNEPTKVTLNNWSLSMMVPPNATFYSYQGTNIVCDSAQVVVFGSMINIDSNAFALLVKNVKRTPSTVQPLGDREVFFNSGEQLPGGQMPKDGKIYMRLRPKKGDGKTKDRDIKQPDITGPQKREQDKAGFFGYISQWARDQTEINGVFSLINAILLFLAFGLAVYCAYKYSEKLQILLYLNDKASESAVWLRSKVVGGVANYKASKLASATSSSSSSTSKAAVFTNPLAKAAPKTPSMEKAAEEVSSKVVPNVLGPVDDITTKSSTQDMSPSARKLDIPAAAAPAVVKPVTNAVDTVADAVTSNPVGEAASNATKSAEKKKGLQRVDSGLLPGITGKSKLDRGQASTRAMGFGTTGVNVDKLLPTTGKSESDASKDSNTFSSTLGTKKAQGPTRARRNSRA